MRILQWVEYLPEPFRSIAFVIMILGAIYFVVSLLVSCFTDGCDGRSAEPKDD